MEMIVTSIHIQQASCGLRTEDTMSGMKSKSECLKYSQNPTVTCSQGMQTGTLVKKSIYLFVITGTANI